MILWEKPGKPFSHAVQRGGNWNNGANAGALSVNLNNAPSNSNSNIGFRCTSQVRSVKSEAAGLPELPALGGSAEKLWEAHRLASQIERGNRFCRICSSSPVFSGKDFSAPNYEVLKVPGDSQYR